MKTQFDVEKAELKRRMYRAKRLTSKNFSFGTDLAESVAKSQSLEECLSYTVEAMAYFTKASFYRKRYLLLSETLKKIENIYGK